MDRNKDIIIYWAMNRRSDDQFNRDNDVRVKWRVAASHSGRSGIASVHVTDSSFPYTNDA